MTYKKFLFGLGATALFWAFLSGTASAAATVDHISVSPVSTTVMAGETVTWKVTAHKTDSSTSDVTTTASFDVPASAGGSLNHNAFTTQYVGQWEIPVSVGSYTATAYVNVVHSSPVTLLVTPDAVKTTADDTISFATKLKDAYGNTWNATGQTSFTTTEKNADLNGYTYAFKKIGSFVVTARIAGLQVLVPVVVTPGVPATLLLSPSEKFTLSVGSTQDISTKLFDADGNIITSKQAGLTLVGDAAILTSTGDLKGLKPGTVTLHAGYGSIDAQTEIEVVKATTTSTLNSSGRVLGETVAATDEDTSNQETDPALTTTQNENTQNTEATDSETCKTLELWVTLVMLATYALILLGYYALIKRDEDKSWWIFPALITAIGIIIWSKYFCEGTYAWWPWILGLIGIFITWYGRGPMRKNSPDDIAPGSPIPPEGQKPLF
jgi:hypothetical protein